MRVIQFRDMIGELACQVAVAEGMTVGVMLPGSKMDLVNGHRTVKRRRSPAPIHPFLILPRVLEIGNDGRKSFDAAAGFSRWLHAKGIGIGLVA